MEWYYADTDLFPLVAQVFVLLSLRQKKQDNAIQFSLALKANGADPDQKFS